jgi:hypothetical protein
MYPDKYIEPVRSSLSSHAGKNYQFPGLASFLDDSIASVIISTNHLIDFSVIMSARLHSNVSPFFTSDKLQDMLGVCIII